MQFEFATAAKILFGAGKLNTIGEIIAGMGDSILVVYGVPTEIRDRISDLLELTGRSVEFIHISSEPSVEDLQNSIAFARHLSANLVIGIGGGSAIDTAKATAALLSNPGEVTDYLEVIGLNKPLIFPSIPVIAIPTTAGTGAEVTKNAVVAVPSKHVKVSLRSPYLFPEIALVDPELTLSMPPQVTASTGLDALTQLIEPYTCNSPNPLTDALCLEGIRHLANSLLAAYQNGKALTARVDMSLASLFSGLALANAKLGAVHGLAGPIGGMISAPHGAICARLLPLVMEVNLQALTLRAPHHPSINRYAEIGRLLSGKSGADQEAAVRWVIDICKQMHIQPLSAYGLTENQFAVIIERAKQSSSMRGNPITLSDEELRNILRRAL
jgi:alcohol dehydrogenase class IV